MASKKSGGAGRGDTQRKPERKAERRFPWPVASPSQWLVAHSPRHARHRAQRLLFIGPLASTRILALACPGRWDAGPTWHARRHARAPARQPAEWLFDVGATLLALVFELSPGLLSSVRRHLGLPVCSQLVQQDCEGDVNGRGSNGRSRPSAQSPGIARRIERVAQRPRWPEQERGRRRSWRHSWGQCALDGLHAWPGERQSSPSIFETRSNAS